MEKYKSASNTELTSRAKLFLSIYSAQGFHRTGTKVDLESGTWFQKQLQRNVNANSSNKVEIHTEEFRLNRVCEDYDDLSVIEIINATNNNNNKVVTSVNCEPYYGCGTYDKILNANIYSFDDYKDGKLKDNQIQRPAVAFLQDTHPSSKGGLINAGNPTMVGKIRKKFGDVFDGFIILLELTEIKKSNKIASINADPFDEPFGPLTLQVPPSSLSMFSNCIKSNIKMNLIPKITIDTNATSFNVVASIQGSDSSLRPIVVMTPRSGWNACCSERGPGMFVLNEIFRSICQTQLKRTVLFTASSGHELGHIGLDNYFERREKINENFATDCFMWLHLGANFGATTKDDNPITYQASDKELENILMKSFLLYGDRPSRPLTKVGERPVGEARNVYDRNGRFLSLVGFNPLFHHPDDVYPASVDIPLIVDICKSLTYVIYMLAALDEDEWSDDMDSFL